MTERFLAAQPLTRAEAIERDGERLDASDAMVVDPPGVGADGSSAMVAPPGHRRGPGGGATGSTEWAMGEEPSRWPAPGDGSGYGALETVPPLVMVRADVSWQLGAMSRCAALVLS